MKPCGRTLAERRYGSDTGCMCNQCKLDRRVKRLNAKQPKPAAKVTVSDRFPWNAVKGWSVSSLANGNMLVEPQWNHKPGLLARMRMSIWLLQRLRKRGAAVQSSGDLQNGGK